MKHKPRMLQWLVALVTLSLANCSRPATTPNPVGIYHRDFGYGAVTLELMQGGNFSEQFVYKSGETFNRAGQWELRHLDGETRVVIIGAMIRPDFRGPTHGPEFLTWTFRVRESANGVVLEMVPDPDQAVVLRRIS